MKILIAGMARSGSTLLFNIIFKLCETKYNSIKTYNKPNLVPEETSPGEIHILKIHGYDEGAKLWADLIFTSRRDMRDATASWCRRDGHKNDYQRACETNLGWHKEWAPYSNYEFVYKEYKNNPKDIIFAVANILKINDLSQATRDFVFHFVETILKNPELPEEDDMTIPLYQETFLSRSHATNGGKIGGYKEYFAVEELNAINEICDKWLVKYGYKA